MTRRTTMVAAFLCVTLLACSKSEDQTSGQKASNPSAQKAEKRKAPPPTFSLAWSEYPSWSTFGVADELGLLQREKGKMGSIEKKWNVDIVLKEADYDTCITLYGNGEVDAAALTNMDSLIPAASRPTVAILPTSTSFGADALIVTKAIRGVKDLKGKKVFGLAKTVSEYMFDRNLVLMKEDPANYTFSNMDPAAAATAMQQRQEKYNAIAVWNPFVLETLKRRDDVRVLFDSTKIPGEIIDMVVVADSSLSKEGGDRFAHAVIDTFYAISDRLNAPATREDTLVALGEKFSNLDAEAMAKVVTQTQFYDTPDKGLEVFTGTKLPEIMTTVVDFCKDKEIVEKKPTIGYGDKASAGDVNFRFDPSYMITVAARKK